MNPHFGTPGTRCTAMDGLGNRCIKDLEHARSSHPAEHTHDASRGAAVRRWM